MAAARAGDEVAELKKLIEGEKTRAYDAQKASDETVQKLRSEVATLSQDSRRLKEVNDSLAASESKVQTLTADLANATASSGNASAELDKLRAEANALKDELAAKTEEAAAAKKATKQEQSNVEQLKQQLQSTNKQIADLKKDKTSLEAGSKSQNAAQANEVARLNTHVQELEQNMADMETKNNDLQSNIEHLKEQLKADVAAVMQKYEKAKAAKETLKAKAQEQAAQLRADLKAKFMAQAEAQKAKTKASFEAGIAKKVKSALTKAFKNVAVRDVLNGSLVLVIRWIFARILVCHVCFLFNIYRRTRLIVMDSRYPQAQLEGRETVKSSAALGALKKAMKQILSEK